jgi:selenobiotic family peptide radical SAM maturase
MKPSALHEQCPVTASFLEQSALSALSQAAGHAPDTLREALRSLVSRGEAPPFLPDLCVLETTMARVAAMDDRRPAGAVDAVPNPALEVCILEWTGCADVILGQGERQTMPTPGRETLLVWKRAGRVHAAPADPGSLAALKVVSEDIDPGEAVKPGGQGLVRTLLARAADKGLILPPPSRIRRDPADISDDPNLPDEMLEADVFTLQWHLTQACDLSCRHCYDRSARSEMPLGAALETLAEFDGFCRDRNVRGQISLSGGNPLLYPHFFEVYGRAAEAGFSLAILGNPTPRRVMEDMAAVARPVYFQVSLEGLPEHNDSIRGRGHFDRTMEFLDVLRDLDIQGQVMLTLTRDNMDQVLPLAEMLEGRVWGLAFNRLSPVGRGASLAMPDPERFQDFVADYCEAAGRLAVLSFKDNMLNARLARTNRPTFGGCTGFGCGAAFNFMALLPDGEVHACRKFPSLIGHADRTTLGEIYDGPEAARYRRRSRACRGCSISAVCGGCPAVVSGLGLDLAEDRDPYCPGPILPGKTG